ncbi:MerR family transcriptional regulator [Lacrimispora sp. AGF001]|uniref:MerR family transcriptional regulator n=1 Tax=Lacrimispora sp. AGF001 TaxID=3401631 RepID=UPI003B430083
MFQIGEFSKLTHVTIRMLRYYDEAGLLKPAEIDSWTGYRMYSADQIPILNKIIYLRDSGFTVSEIAAALTIENDASLVTQLDRKQLEVKQAIQAEQEKINKIELAKNELLNKKSEMHYNISIKSIPGCPVLSLRRTIPDYYAEGDLWQELSDFAAEHQIQISKNTFSIYYDTEYREKDVDVELCAPVKRQGENIDGFTFRNVDPVPMMACTMVYGAFSNIAGAYLAFAQWLHENSQYEMSSPTRQLVHRGPWNESSPEKYLIEIQIPLKNK